MTEQKPKIFLSYAHEDIGMTKKIYQDLKRYGLNIWFDYESLLGRQNWKFEINNAIKESTYFLALLSKESIDSIGYVQKELKIALEMLDSYPENKTYILPVRIEDCEPLEERLSDLHWINVFPENEYQNGLNKILQVVSPGTFLLRSKPMELSENDVQEMIKRYNFYDRNRNISGESFFHKYKQLDIKGDKIIFDEASGLMWQQSGSEEEMAFEKDVKKYIDELNEKRFAGFNDWRLPTLEEAMSLMEPNSENDRYIDPIFGDQEWIWTADRVQAVEGRQWVVIFYSGYLQHSSLNNDFHVRAVSFGQS